MDRAPIPSSREWPISVTDLRFVLFDAVGTLLRVQPSVTEIYLAVASRHGSRLTTDEIRRGFTKSIARHHDDRPTSESRERERWMGIVEEVLHDISHAGNGPFEELWDAFSRPEHWALFDDVAEVWVELQRRGYSLGIASNFDQRLRKLCRGLPPLDTANQLFVSSQIGFPKPHHQFFRRVERELGAEPTQLLLIGDSRHHDVDGALAAGWQVLHLCRGETRDDTTECFPVITSLRSLLKLLP